MKYQDSFLQFKRKLGRYGAYRYRYSPHTGDQQQVAFIMMRERVYP
jgi:hypothetical protein